MRRFLLKSVAACVALAMGVSSCVALRSRDLPPPDDTDLMLKVVDVTPHKNGYVLLTTLTAGLDVPRDHDYSEHQTRVLLQDEEPNERVAAVLAQNRVIVEGMSKVIEAKFFQFPERGIKEIGSLPYLELAYLLAMQAYDHARHARSEEALQISLIGVALAHRIQNAERATLVDMILALSMANIACEGLRRSIPLLTIHPAVARRAAEELESHRSDPEGWSRMWATEYRFGKDTLGELVQPNGTRWLRPSWSPMAALPDAYVFQPNRTQEWLADHYRSAQRDSALVCTQLEPAPRKPSDWQRLRTALDRNGLASVVLETLSDPRRFQQRRCLVDTDLAATATLLGLRAHRMDHAELADSLEELVPSYLVALPHDGFEGKPLRYSKTTRRLYSRGSDAVDRGGDTDPSTRRSLDLFAREPTYRIPF